MSELWQLSKANKLLNSIPERLPYNETMLDSDTELRSHELVIAVGPVMGLDIEHGYFYDKPHSWLRTSQGNILDVYCINSFPQAQLKENNVFAQAYKEDNNVLNQLILNQTLIKAIKARLGR